jgi:predicted ATPase
MDREHLHFFIGCLLKHRSTSEAGVLFQVADHLNLGRFVSLEEDKVALAKINQSAARSSANKSAFDVSAEYVVHGMAIVDSVDTWKDFRALAVELSTFAARICYITGQFHQCHLKMFSAIQAVFRYSTES